MGVAEVTGWLTGRSGRPAGRPDLPAFLNPAINAATPITASTLTWELMPLGAMTMGIVADRVGAPVAVAAGAILSSSLTGALWLAACSLREIWRSRWLLVGGCQLTLLGEFVNDARAFALEPRCDLGRDPAEPAQLLAEVRHGRRHRANPFAKLRPVPGSQSSPDLIGGRRFRRAIAVGGRDPVAEIP
jgi:hypothetical protein